MPVKKWSFERIATYGEKFFMPCDRKITLNFALAESSPIDVNILKEYFPQRQFLIKLTPINPTFNASKNNIKGFVDPKNSYKNTRLVQKLEDAGYEVLLSIGELKENDIGSNCGQYIQQFKQVNKAIDC